MLAMSPCTATDAYWNSMLFEPICYKTVETQTDEMNNTSTNPSEKTSNKLPLPGHDRAYRRLSRS